MSVLCKFNSKELFIIVFIQTKLRTNYKLIVQYFNIVKEIPPCFDKVRILCIYCLNNYWEVVVFTSVVDFMAL